MREIVVTTGSRLHFGLLAMNPDADRQFGGIGMMIDEPGFRITARLANATAVSFENDQTFGAQQSTVAKRIRKFAKTHPDYDFEFVVENIIPSHSGLGSGTQLALAVGSAMDRLTGGTASVAEIAQRSGRGKRSAIGIHGFEHGGFIFDGGQRSGGIGILETRSEFPSDWRIVLITPTQTEGLWGDQELAVFKQLPPMSPDLTQQLFGIIKETTPAVKGNSFPSFAGGLQRYGDLVGQFFQPVQGGIFCAPVAREIAAELQAVGHQGIVQSSWGPTICAMCPSVESANAVAKLVNKRSDSNARVVAGRNTAADIRMS